MLPPGVPWPYVIVVLAIVVCATTLGAARVIDGPEVSYVLVASLSAAGGHLIGYTAGRNGGD